MAAEKKSHRTVLEGKINASVTLARGRMLFPTEADEKRAAECAFRLDADQCLFSLKAAEKTSGNDGFEVGLRCA